MKPGKQPTRFGGPSTAFLARKAAKDAGRAGETTTEGGVRLYLDDERPCPTGWTLARSPGVFFEMVGGDHDLSDHITHLSLDWYLGVGVVDGEAVAARLAQRFRVDPGFLPKLRAVGLHSSDHDKARSMFRTLRDSLPAGRDREIRFDIGTPRR